MDTKLKSSRKKELFLVLIITLCPAILTFCCYPMFRNRVMRQTENQTVSEPEVMYEEYYGDGYISDVYRSGYVFYEDFVKGGTERPADDDTAEDGMSEAMELYYERRNIMENLRGEFLNFISYTDYYVMDLETSSSETNTAENQELLEQYVKNNVSLENDLYDAWLCIAYDSYGDVRVKGYHGLNADFFIQEFQVMRHGQGLETQYGVDLTELEIDEPKNMIVFYGFQDIEQNTDWNTWYTTYRSYMKSGIVECYLLMLAAITLVTVWFRRKEVFELNRSRVFRLPLEGTFIGVFFPFVLLGPMVEQMTNYLYRAPSEYMEVPTGIVGGMLHILLWWLLYLLWFWLMGCLAPVLQIGPWKYIKGYSVIYRFFPFMKRQWKRFVAYIQDVDLTENMEKSIWKVVLVNGAVVAILCTMWFGGIVGVVIYSIFLFFYLRKYFTGVQTQYKAMLAWVRELSAGNLNAKMEEEAGIFEPFKQELGQIQTGFKRAVEEEVRSQRMKNELITNVSHDLKTPLTAIITYVDLLKREDITAEEREDYIRILDKKSMRLKVLIEDLFEVSKASSNNVTLRLTDVDIVNLLKQVRFEQEEKIAASGLDFRWNLPEEKLILRLDSQKTYRVFENLLINILKYSMERSRVYIDVKDLEDYVVTTMKNMSATELNFDPKEITERFVRGDLSRNTEGSGLGLAIARSFTELQGGTLDIEIDGDLFKAIVTFKK